MTTLSILVVEEVDRSMDITLHFKEWLIDEGLWMADKPAVAGTSRINTTPFPRSRYRERPYLKPPKPPKVKPLFKPLKPPTLGTFKPKKIVFKPMKIKPLPTVIPTVRQG